MFLCSPCHVKSTCRSEVHLNISRMKCEVCGHMADCFECASTGLVRRAFPDQIRQVEIYRNTKLLGYRKIEL